MWRFLTSICLLFKSVTSTRKSVRLVIPVLELKLFFERTKKQFILTFSTLRFLIILSNFFKHSFSTRLKK